MDFFTIQEALKTGMSLELSTLSTNPQPLDFTGFVGFGGLPFLFLLCYTVNTWQGIFESNVNLCPYDIIAHRPSNERGF